MKAMFRNYFKGGKLYQWDELMNIYSISNTDIKHEFCLDQEGMQNLMKFENPIIQVGKTLKVIGNKLTANIKLVDCEFIVPTMEFEKECIVDVDKLKKAAKFVGKKNAKPMLQGVSLKDKYIQATNSFIACNFENEGGLNVILPIHFINEIEKEKMVKLLLSKNRVKAIKSDGSEIISNLIEGSFPQLEKLFGNKGTNSFKLNKKDLSNLLSFASLGSVIIGDKVIKIISHDNEFELNTDISINDKIILSLTQFKQIINLIDEEEINVKYTSALKPLYINDNYLILPIREV